MSFMTVPRQVCPVADYHDPYHTLSVSLLATSILVHYSDKLSTPSHPEARLQWLSYTFRRQAQPTTNLKTYDDDSPPQQSASRGIGPISSPQPFCMVKAILARTLTIAAFFSSAPPSRSNLHRDTTIPPSFSFFPILGLLFHQRDHRFFLHLFYLLLGFPLFFRCDR